MTLDRTRDGRAAPAGDADPRQGWRRIGPPDDYTLWFIEPGLFCIEVRGRLTFDALLRTIKLMQRHPGWRDRYYVMLDLLAHPDYDRGLLNVKRDPDVPPAAAMAVVTRSTLYRMVATSAALASRVVNGTVVRAHDSLEKGVAWLRQTAAAAL